jgi:hypothetical protein
MSVSFVPESAAVMFIVKQDRAAASGNCRVHAVIAMRVMKKEPALKPSR